MKQFKLYAKILILMVVMGIGLPVLAGEVAIIINSSNTQTLTASDIKNIYMENVVNWKNGKKIKVYDQRPNTDVREIFSRSVLGMSANNAASEASNRKITNTSTNPSKISGEKLIISVVSRNPNAIGYVNAANIAGKKGIRIVHRYSQ